MSSPPSSPIVSLTVAPSKAEVGPALCAALVPLALEALEARGAFSVALSGGSLPAFLAGLPQAFVDTDPQFDKWHVLLADERCVPETHEDSNLKALREHVLDHWTGLPASQVYGIHQTLLDDTAAVAKAYEQTVQRVLTQHTGGALDVAVLGFGPDGHTCSLFPGHSVLHETQAWVAPVKDSPKPPPRRVTLTLAPLLNARTRHVLFGGAGASKSPILQANFANVVEEQETTTTQNKTYTVEMAPLTEASYPCARVRPNADPDNNKTNTVTWIVDAEAMSDIAVASTRSSS